PKRLLDIYYDLIFRARFICLDLLKDNEITELLRENLVEYLQLPVEHINFVDALRKSFTRFVLPADIEPFVLELFNALKKNEEVLGSKSLTTNNGSAQAAVKPT